MNSHIEHSNEPGLERINTVCLDQFCEDHLIDRVDLLKLDIQGQEHSALAGSKQLICTGRIETIFMELNWARNEGPTCPASEAIRLLDQAGYRFSKVGQVLNWHKSGDWLRTLSDVVARRV